MCFFFFFFLLFFFRGSCVVSLFVVMATICKLSICILFKELYTIIVPTRFGLIPFSFLRCCRFWFSFSFCDRDDLGDPSAKICDSVVRYTMSGSVQYYVFSSCYQFKNFLTQHAKGHIKRILQTILRYANPFYSPCGEGSDLSP